MVGHRSGTWLLAGTMLAGASVAAQAADTVGAGSSYDWSGFYAGGHAGYGWGDADLSPQASPVGTTTITVPGMDLCDVNGTLTPLIELSEAESAALFGEGIVLPSLLEDLGFGEGRTFDIRDPVTGEVTGTQTIFPPLEDGVRGYFATPGGDATRFPPSFRTMMAPFAWRKAAGSENLFAASRPPPPRAG